MANGIKPTDFPAISGELTGTEEIYTQEGGVNGKFTVDDVKNYILPEKTILYKEVDISSAQILNSFDSPVEILPALSNQNEYYEFEAIMEYNYGTTPYSMGLFTIQYDNQSLGLTDTDFIQNADDNAFLCITNKFNNALSMTYLRNVGFKRPVVFANNQDFAVSNPTGGDGTIKIKIWYEIKNFG